MTDAEILAAEQAATSPAQRLIVALAEVHAARWAAIRDLTLDDLDLPNRPAKLPGSSTTFLANPARLRSDQALKP